MKFLNIEQHLPGGAANPEWLEWRAKGLGGSDVAAVMGESPFCSREKLLREKLGLEVREENFAMRRGARLEPVARGLAEKRLGMLFPAVCVEHDDTPWMRASLDGLYAFQNHKGFFTGEGEIMEIKCPSWQSHEIALEGILPRYYLLQVQYQLLVTGLDLCHYVSFSMHSRYASSPELQLAILPVKADAELQAEILDAAESFWNELEAARQGSFAGAA